MNDNEPRWEAEEWKVTRITNADLACGSCAFAYDDTEIYGNTSRCEKYPAQKPLGILDGEGCGEHS